MASPSKPQQGHLKGRKWSDILPLNKKEPGCRDDRAVKVVSGRGFRHVLPFPYKLHVMLDEVEQVGADYIVSWLSNGDSFKVHIPDEFIHGIVPLYFKQRQYKSFQRQLHLYGFQRKLDGPEKGAYFHPCFLRKDRNLCYQVVRKLNKADKKANQSIKYINDRSRSMPVPNTAASSGTSMENENEDDVIDVKKYAPKTLSPLLSPASNPTSFEAKPSPSQPQASAIEAGVNQPQSLDDSELDTFDDIDGVMNVVGVAGMPMSPARGSVSQVDVTLSSNATVTTISPKQPPLSSVSFQIESSSAVTRTPVPSPTPAAALSDPSSSVTVASTLSWLLNQGIPLAELSSALHANPISPVPEQEESKKPPASLLHSDLVSDVISLFGDPPKNEEPQHHQSAANSAPLSSTAQSPLSQAPNSPVRAPENSSTVREAAASPITALLQMAETSMQSSSPSEDIFAPDSTFWTGV